MIPTLDQERWQLQLLHRSMLESPRPGFLQGCEALTADTHVQIRQLKQLQQEMAQLQIANAQFRESMGLKAFARFKRKLLRQPEPPDEIRQLNERIQAQEAKIRQQVTLIEMSDSYFLQYRPCGDQFVRVPPGRLRQLSERYFETSMEVELGRVCERFQAMRTIFSDYPPDLRILGFIGLLAACESEFDAPGFFLWDERLVGMIYGRDAAPTHPQTFDRFLIHALLHTLPTGSISDRYISFRIGWDLFRGEWAKHFRHQLRALVATAQLLHSPIPFPSEEEAFTDFYQRQIGRYRQLMRSIHHRAAATDAQMGRGVSIQGMEMGFGPAEAGGGGMASIFEGVSLGQEARLGIPDPLFVVGARLSTQLLALDRIHQQFNEMLQVLDFLDDPTLVASILADTPLYVMDRQDQRRSFELPEPGVFAQTLRDRFQAARKTASGLSLGSLHLALIALLPGPVAESLRQLDELSDRLVGIPEQARRLLAFLLLDGGHPLSRHHRFTYELWLAEGRG